MKEDKPQRFKRMAEKKVGLAARALRDLNALKAPRYEYTDADVDKIAAFLQKQLNEITLALKSRKKEPEPQFKL